MDLFEVNCMKIEFGSNGRKMDGWLCTDIDTVDIRNALPWPDGSVEMAMASHVVEHITPHEAFRFFKEVHRVLKPGGVFRVIVPTLELIEDRLHAVSLILDHGHQMVFSKGSLGDMIWAAGFERENITFVNKDPILDVHGKEIGEEKDALESARMVAIKCAASGSDKT